MNKKHTWHVGQQVYVVPTDTRWSKPYDATVIRVGRKYGELAKVGYDGRQYDDITFVLESGLHENGGYQSRYAVHPSRAQYEAENAANAVRRRVREYFKPYGYADVLTQEDYQIIADLLTARGVP